MIKFPSLRGFFGRKVATLPGLDRAKFEARVVAALSGAPAGGSSKLPDVPPPKVKPKQASYPGYLTSTQTSTSVIQRVDSRLTNIDITNTYREAVAGLPATERIDYSIPLGLEF